MAQRDRRDHRQIARGRARYVSHNLPPTAYQPATTPAPPAAAASRPERTKRLASANPSAAASPISGARKYMPDGRQAGPVPSEIYRHTGWVTRRRRCVKLGDLLPSDKEKCVHEAKLPMQVWDAPTRLFHWTIVVLLCTGWLTQGRGWMELHFLSGYSIITLLLFRLAWGFVGSDTSRFSGFLKNSAGGPASPGAPAPARARYGNRP